jgi:hypothetical protein
MFLKITKFSFFPMRNISLLMLLADIVLEIIDPDSGFLINPDPDLNSDPRF